MSHTHFINPSKCTTCGICIKDCSALRSRKHTYKTVQIGIKGCDSCFHCYAICPNEAIERVSPPLLASTPNDEKPIHTHQMLHLLASRRSTRLFDTKEVNTKTLEDLFSAIHLNPSGGNRHCYQLTVLENNETRKQLIHEIQGVYRKKEKLVRNPLIHLFARFFVDPFTKEFITDPDYSQRLKTMFEEIRTHFDLFFYEAPIALLLHTNTLIPTPKEDCLLVGYNIALAAETMGLGSCFVTMAQTIINSSVRCKKTIGLTNKDHVHVVLVLGYPRFHYHRPVYHDFHAIRHV